MPWPPPQDPAGEGVRHGWWISLDHCPARALKGSTGNGSARIAPEFRHVKIRRAARRLCRSEIGLVCMPRQKRRHAAWRKLARGPKTAGWCPHPTGRAVPLSHARTVTHENGLWPRPARAWPCVENPGTPGPRRLNADPFPNPQGGPPQARFHPRSGCQPAQTGTRNRNLSGGWLGPPGRCGR